MELHHVFALLCALLLAAIILPRLEVDTEEITAELHRLGWTEVQVSGRAPMFTCGRHDFTQRAISGRLPNGARVHGSYCANLAGTGGPRGLRP